MLKELILSSRRNVMESFIPETRQVPVEHDPFDGPAIVRTVPTTAAQREVYAASAMGADANRAYVESVSLVLTGKLDRPALKQAVRDLVDRHESLRSVISSNGMRMIVFAEQPLDIPFKDLSALTPAERNKELQALAEADMNEPFDLVRGPLFRVMLTKTAPEEHILRLSGHHVVVDGWSLGILMAETSALYNAHVKKTVPQLPAAEPFSKYVLATIDLEKSSAYQDIEQYWLDLFKGATPRMDLPTDRRRPEQKTYRGNRLDLGLDPELVRGLRNVATRNGASFVTTLLSAFEVLLHRLTGASDIVTGLPAAGQSDMDMKHLVGHCVNLLALRSHIDGDQPFNEYLKERRGQVLDAFDHQKYTFGTLVQKLRVPREPGRIPLVPVVFNIDMNMDDGVAFDGLAHRFVSNPRHFENFELFLNATGQGDQLTLEWSYNTDLFDAPTVHGWMEEFSSLIARIIADSGSPVRNLASTAELPSKKLPVPPQWHGLATAIPRTKSVDALFEEVAQQHADRVALVAPEGDWTYKQLRQRVHAIAQALQAAGVRPGNPVGLCMDRSPDMVAGMLAIMHCGGAFVPFDPSYPQERLAYMFADTAVEVLLTQRSLMDMLPTKDVHTLVAEEIRGAAQGGVPALGKAEAPAYIMYTSGSTGTPKGVVVPHRAIVRLVKEQNYLPFGPDLTFLQLSNISFDASTLELWGALLNGAKLVLLPQQKPTLKEIVGTIQWHKVTTVWFTAGLFNLLVDEHLDDLKGLDHILTGGDVLSVAHVKRALRVLGPGVLINGYGPTENTTFTCCHVINSEEGWNARVPIGRPVHNSTVHLLDERMRPVGIGETGELYTGGDGVALGYWRRPELTAELFVDDPFSDKPGAKLYRTGDLACWLPDGTIDFLGRSDGQVKIRGFRVELGEIENAIAALPAVKDCVVMARNDMPGEKQLVAYLVPVVNGSAGYDAAQQETFIGLVREHLKRNMPSYMVPTALVVLDELPLNANGKVDKHALPAPRHRSQTTTASHVEPRTRTEQQLAKHWSELLEVPNIGIHDNFFDLGGHSMVGIQLLAHIEADFGVQLPLNSLFQAPTIASFAKLLESGPAPVNLANLAALQPEGGQIPFFCVHGDEANHHIMRHLGKDQPYYGFFHQGEDGSAFKHRTVEEIAAHYISEMQLVQPGGPYLLGGYSFGGIIAYEMAVQLTSMGHEVPLLAMFDMHAPGEFTRYSRDAEKIYEPLKRVIMRQMVKRQLAKGKIRSPRLRHFHIIDNYHHAILAYKPRPYQGPVTVFKAARSPGTDDMGWSTLVSGPIDVHVLPGDHYSLIKDGEVERLVQQLSVSIDRAVSKHIVEAV